MLDIFILESGTKGASEEKLMASFDRPKDDERFKDFENLNINFHVVQRVDQINKIVKEGEWYMTLFDNEFIDPSLLRVLHVYMAQEQFNVYVIMKRTQDEEADRVVTESPRLFRSELALQDGSFLPESEDLHSERNLDGWILDDKSA